jgi:hypothetical protein
MALTNAEHQARHRERLKARFGTTKEDASTPLRNDLLHEMRLAFESAHESAVKAAVTQIDARPLLAGESDWYTMREYLLNHRTERELASDFFIELAKESGRKIGDYLVMRIYRDFLVEQIETTPSIQTGTKRKRKSVT